MVGYIYLNTDLKTGKQYAGQHHYDKEGELDPNYHGSGVLWTKVLKKRPKELIKEEYIKTCYSEEEMNSDEQYYIKLFKTLWPNGYNLTEGGEGFIPCEEIRRKLSKVHKGRTPPNKGIPMSEEQKKKLSELLKGRTPPNKGKHHSDEARKKMSESHKGIQAGEKHPMFGKHHSEESKKKMSQNHYDCSGEKNPMFGKHLSEESKKNISQKQKGKKLSEETRRKMSKARINGKISKKVLQFTLDGEFVREWESTQECGRNGFNQGHVAECCRGERKSHKGFIFKYA